MRVLKCSQVLAKNAEMWNFTKNRETGMPELIGAFLNLSVSNTQNVALAVIRDDIWKSNWIFLD
jgi:hypothetical protein